MTTDQIAAELENHLARESKRPERIAAIKSAIEKAISQFMDDSDKGITVTRAKQASEPDLGCMFCGRPPHPDSYGHSYRPSAAQAGEK